MEALPAEKWQVGLLLLLAPEVEDDVCKERGGKRGEGERHIAIGQLLEHERVRHRRTRLPGAAIGLWDLCRGQSELPHALQELLGHTRRLVALSGDRAHGPG